MIPSNLSGKRNRYAYLFVLPIVVLCILYTSLFLRKPRPLPSAELRLDPFHGSHDTKPRKTCIGPRGKPLQESVSEDLPQSRKSLENVEFPSPTTGSYEAAGQEQSWLSFEARYGPYGFGEETPEYGFSRVEWEKVDWGRLQDQCLIANGKQDDDLGLMAKPRFRLQHEAEVPDSPREKTGRQAIVLRAYSTYKYAPEDFWNLRSIINEASLATGGEYTVFLLVDIKDEDGSTIHQDDALYEMFLEQSVPPEFRNMAVLFHESLQKSWYSKVDEFAYVFKLPGQKTHTDILIEHSGKSCSPSNFSRISILNSTTTGK